MGDLSKHFSRSEFTCKCGCGFDTVDAELIMFLELARAHFDRAITINSGCRCRNHNNAVNGSVNSLHLDGRAADIVVEGTPPNIVQEYFEQRDVPGLGEYNSFTHVDSRSGHARWIG